MLGGVQWLAGFAKRTVGGGDVDGVPSANIFVAFCSDMPFICSSTLRGLVHLSVTIHTDD